MRPVGSGPGSEGKAIQKTYLSLTVRPDQTLGLKVVAEGVETQVEASSLRSLQCEFAQGFLFGAPMTANQAYNFLAASLRPAPAPRGPTISRACGGASVSSAARCAAAAS